MLKADIGSIGAVKRFVEAFRKSHHDYLSARFLAITDYIKRRGLRH